MLSNKICYCFDYTETDIRADIVQHGRSTLLERILAEKRAGRCQCAVKNPTGR